jgi:hypothetical protein
MLNQKSPGVTACSTASRCKPSTHAFGKSSTNIFLRQGGHREGFLCEVLSMNDIHPK